MVPMKMHECVYMHTGVLASVYIVYVYVCAAHVRAHKYM